jgi:molybdenum cofactor cytidylyltransferase
LKIGAVLLAAGASRRFGTGSKLLADIHSSAGWLKVIAHSGAGEIVVVTGCDHLLIEKGA